MSGTGDLRRIEADLTRAASRILPEVDAVLKKGATNLKRDMQDAFKESDYFTTKAGAPPRISYDRTFGPGTVGYEVGPEIGGLGSLAGVAVEGGANGGGGSVDIDTPAKAEAQAVEKYLGKIMDGLL
ncbi:hypothetical protein [Isoptericola sp. NPDC056605]|uniref:hypothetical protein n=1 Tax=Isoptericola sp. NPDC056605 TaxID=3345876 RepID=UPI003689FD30